MVAEESSKELGPALAYSSTWLMFVPSRPVLAAALARGTRTRERLYDVACEFISLIISSCFRKFRYPGSDMLLH